LMLSVFIGGRRCLVEALAKTEAPATPLLRPPYNLTAPSPHYRRGVQTVSPVRSFFRFNRTRRSSGMVVSITRLKM
jgi:hypothetical protein